jgi:hypothetical protein
MVEMIRMRILIFPAVIDVDDIRRDAVITGRHYS